MTDSQRKKIQGDACFLLLVCSLRQEPLNVSLTHSQIKTKYWEVLQSLIRVYQIPGYSKITCLICALLLKLSRCSTAVKQFFSTWLKVLESLEATTEAEDEIHSVKVVAELYSRAVVESPTLSVRALKTLLKLQEQSSDILECILKETMCPPIV